MPGEIIDRPNPQPLPSHIPDSVEQLQVKLDRINLDQSACDGLFKFRRAAAYIAAGGRERQNNTVRKTTADNSDSDDLSPG